MKDMKILGIDPGLGIVGFGMLEYSVSSDSSADSVRSCDWGVITTSKDKSDSARLQEIYHDLTSVVQQFQPDVVSVEKIFFFRNATTVIPVSQARGVILLVMQMFNVPLFEYTPMQVKQAMSGYGKASKKEVQEMVARILNLDTIPKPDDAADALALALCHYQFNGRMQQLIGSSKP